jgi:hypothetical protein
MTALLRQEYVNLIIDSYGKMTVSYSTHSEIKLSIYDYIDMIIAAFVAAHCVDTQEVDSPYEEDSQSRAPTKDMVHSFVYQIDNLEE